MTNRAARVLVVDDHAPIREGLAIILDHEDTLTVVGQAASGPEAIKAAVELVPDVVVMDLDLPGCSGVEACQRIGELLPTARVLILTGSTDPRGQDKAARAGAVGYLRKTGSLEHIVEAVHAAAGAR